MIVKIESLEVFILSRKTEKVFFVDLKVMDINFSAFFIIVIQINFEHIF